MTAADDLRSAIAALVTVGVRAGLEAEALRIEAESWSAALVCADPLAAHAWCDAMGVGAPTFSTRAAIGEPWLRTPTPLLRRLVANGSTDSIDYANHLALLASAACSLCEPSLHSIDVATMAAAAQLSVAGVPTRPPTPDPSIPPVVLESSVVAVEAGSTPQLSTQQPTVQSPPPPPSLADLLGELDALVGLAAVKQEIHRQTELLRVAKLRTDKGLKSPALSRHMVFVGNPGTGKTTVARLVAGIYQALGMLAKGQLVECDRNELVAGYVGQTAMKTADVVASAIGGVLFIDEAYSLATDDFGKEAVDTLVKEMEDHRGELVVIVAGYPRPMETFLHTNPGLESRFGLTIPFADYSDGELLLMFERITTESDFAASDEARIRMGELLAREPRGEGFGNGRFVRNCFESAVGRQAWRLRDVAMPSVEQLRTLEANDLDSGVSQ